MNRAGRPTSEPIVVRWKTANSIEMISEKGNYLVSRHDEYNSYI